MRKMFKYWLVTSDFSYPSTINRLSVNMVSIRCDIERKFDTSEYVMRRNYLWTRLGQDAYTSIGYFCFTTFHTHTSLISMKNTLTPIDISTSPCWLILKHESIFSLFSSWIAYEQKLLIGRMYPYMSNI